MPTLFQCTYEIIGPANAPETGATSSFTIIPSTDTSTSTDTDTDTIPTVATLKDSFPYLGQFHFRARIPSPSPELEYAWLDLQDEDAPLPVWKEEGGGKVQHVHVRVLPLSLPPPPSAGGEEEGELDYSGPDLDEDIAEVSASAYDDRREGQRQGLSNRSRDEQDIEEEWRSARYSSASSSYYAGGGGGGASASSFTRQLKEVGETVLTSDVARDLTKVGKVVGKKVGKQVGKLWKMVGEGLAGGGGGGGLSSSGGGGGGGGGGGDYPMAPSASAIRYLRRWEESLVTPPDVDLLKTMWEAVGLPSGGFAARSREWKRVGFQGEDPLVDLRGTGSVGVQFVVYFASTYRSKFDSILSSNLYPFSPIVTHLTLLLIDLFKLRDGRYAHAHTVFWPLFEGGGFGTLEEIFCATLGYLDRVWVEALAEEGGRGEGVKERFPQLVQEVRGRLEEVLQQQPRSLPHFVAVAGEVGMSIE